MKITDIQIENYGVWNHVALPLPSAGLNVFYGPNEAGKTTLLWFIRDVLYGSQSLKTEKTQSAPPAWHGALRLAHADRYCEVRRWCDEEGVGGLEFQELEPAMAWAAGPSWGTADPGNLDSRTLSGQPAEAALQNVLCETEARLFRHVFAIGLSELQELATLEDQEVADEIYSLSLGIEGRKILSLSSQLGPAPSKSPLAAEIVKRMTDLMDRDRALEGELEQFAGDRDRYDQLLERQAELEAEVQDLKSRQAMLQQQVVGHEILQRIWEPWNQVREYEAELCMLPMVRDVTGIDPSRLSLLENELRELFRRRKAVRAEISRLRKSLRSIAKKSDQQQHAAELQSLLNQRACVVETESELELASARARELQTEFEARAHVLGPEWPIQRLNSIDTSHLAYTKLVDAARSFQSAQARLGSLRKRYEKYADACQHRQAEWDQQIEALPEQSLETAVQTTREQIHQREELNRLNRQETDLEQTIAGRNRELGRLKERSQIPTWVPGFLLFLAISGLVLSALGFYTSLTSNGIAGAILGLVGIAGLAIARAFQWDSDTEAGGESAALEASIREHQQLLEGVRQAIGQHTPETWVVTITDGELATGPDAVFAEKLSERLSDLKRLRTQERRLKSRRRRLSRMRNALQTRQRKVGQTRHDWCAALKDCGLDEAIDLEEAFGLWQKIAEAREHLRAWNEARETASELQQRREAFCRRLAEFGQRTGHANLDENHPLRVLDLLEQEAVALGEGNHEQQAMKRDLRERKREALDLKKKIIAARSARRAFLNQAGVSSREELEQRLEAAKRRKELEELLQMAKAELDMLSEAEPELAIIEEDLLRYDADENQESMDLLLLELEELESRLRDVFQDLDRVKQERQSLETERKPAAIRFQREVVRGKLRECLAQLAALQLAAQAVGRIRGEFEEICQPRILEIASDYLAQLTCGKYAKIRTSLGERRLLLMDAEENHFAVEQLSNGTREQLFLAIRLALVNEFAQRGIELPMVLDDVLVNFDQSRTEAAIETLIEFAERGHQVLLFTSHLHLARLCENQGIPPVWLPAHHAPVEHRRAG